MQKDDSTTKKTNCCRGCCDWRISLCDCKRYCCWAWGKMGLTGMASQCRQLGMGKVTKGCRMLWGRFVCWK